MNTESDQNRGGIPTAGYPSEGTQDVPTDAEIDAKWLELAPMIDRLQERCNDPNDFQVKPMSQLSIDDDQTNPYHTSTTVRMCIVAGIDHLSAIKQLILDGQVLHVAAPHSLARAALETFAAAYWILHPDDRKERVERTLRWWAKNFHDQHQATDDIPSITGPSKNDKYARLSALAEPLNLPDVAKGYTSTDAVRYADTHSDVGVLFPWRMCSGFAHGRPWAYLGALDQVGTAPNPNDPRLQQVQVTNSMRTTLYPTHISVLLLGKLLRVYEARTKPLLHPPPELRARSAVR